MKLWKRYDGYWLIDDGRFIMAEPTLFRVLWRYWRERHIGG